MKKGHYIFDPDEPAMFGMVVPVPVCRFLASFIR
jgi:hypothetical protein